MNVQEAEALVRTALHRVAPEADLDALDADVDLRDELDLDSLDFLRLVELLSAESGVRIDEEDYPTVASLTGAVSFLAGAPA